MEIHHFQLDQMMKVLIRKNRILIMENHFSEIDHNEVVAELKT